MTRDTRIALFLMGELVAALRANDPDLFKRWLSCGVQDLGEPLLEELLLNHLNLFLTLEDLVELRFVPRGGASQRLQQQDSD